MKFKVGDKVRLKGTKCRGIPWCDVIDSVNGNQRFGL